ncbi:predicted protein [Naegleria gruberi]|uniref:Predicted protein n=1 Tax=Naegleria gruberi TaxID=5762 RepID=D2VDR7_NAEGR|nr:uncharacterized protein NAEGRDRAFT_67015 [Naegleria gruberi]EFC44946.1 predicted protein [Naegleria gruberi]|eukprot:XP_002677690.1 predicted protein [Naegleria gruberi strain NEG-M]
MPTPSPKTKTTEYEPLIYRIVAFLQVILSLFFNLTLICLIPFMIVANHRTNQTNTEQLVVLGICLIILTLMSMAKNVGTALASWKGTFMAIQEGLQNHITQQNLRTKRFAMIGCGCAIAHMILGLILSYLGTVFIVMLVDNLDDREFDWGVDSLEFDNPFAFVVAIVHLIFNIAAFGVSVWNLILVTREIAHYHNVKPSGEEESH